MKLLESREMSNKQTLFLVQKAGGSYLICKTTILSVEPS